MHYTEIWIDHMHNTKNSSCARAHIMKILVVHMHNAEKVQKCMCTTLSSSRDFSDKWLNDSNSQKITLMIARWWPIGHIMAHRMAR